MCVIFHHKEKETINGFAQSMPVSLLRSKESSKGQNNTVLCPGLGFSWPPSPLFPPWLHEGGSGALQVANSTLSW